MQWFEKVQRARWLQRLAPVVAFLKRYPGLIALAGFVSGLASFFLVERRESFAKVIAIVMLLSWLWLVLEGLLRRSLKAWFGLSMPPIVLRYLTQLVHQESLFFILPFFWMSTAWHSVQALFTGTLIVAALVSITDPLYYRVLAKKRWLYLAYHSLTLFAVLLTVLPILLKLSTAQSYQYALIAAVLLSLPSLANLLHLSAWRQVLAIVALASILGVGGWSSRAWVPPAGLWLTEAALTTELDNRQRKPGASLTQISSAELKAHGLYAYTAIKAPRGLNEKIVHLWRRERTIVDQIVLNIKGGREQGYRAWTHKLNFPPKPEGQWRVDILTESGQHLGSLRLTVTP